MRHISNLAYSRSPNQELLDENDYLRKKLAALEETSKRKQELHQKLSGAISIGFWERDEVTKRFGYFSREMADCMGISLDSFYETCQSREGFFPFIHPDDLEQYINKLNVVIDHAPARGLAHIIDYHIIRPNGEVRYVRELEYGTQVENGTIVRLAQYRI